MKPSIFAGLSLSWPVGARIRAGSWGKCGTSPGTSGGSLTRLANEDGFNQVETGATPNWLILLYNRPMSRSVSDVSIVTVNWNGRQHLESLLPSLAPLSAREIIVVDNGSSGGSQGFLGREYPAGRLLQNQTQ